MLELIRSWTRRDEGGASAVEYGLLVTGIAAVIVLVVFAFGGVVKGMFSKTCNTVRNSTQTGSAASCNS